MAEQKAYQELVNTTTGRVFRVGESPKQILGYSRWVVIIGAWLAISLAGTLEYTWGALSGSLQALHHWGDAPVFWLFSIYVVCESFVQICTGFLRSKGILSVRWAVILGGVICGVVAYGWLASTSSIVGAYLSYAVLGGIGSGMIYNSCINIVARWYPERKGWRTGFVNGGWAYGAVPFIIGIGATASSSGTTNMNPAQTIHFIWMQGIIMTVIIAIGGFFMKDPPKNWWPTHIDPLNWKKNTRTPRDLITNPPALRQYTLKEMWCTPQPKWLGIQFALYVGSSLFGVSYYYPFAQAMHLGTAAAVAGFAGFSLADGIFRPVYGYVSEFMGRRRLMALAYALNAVFQALTLVFGLIHNTPGFVISAVISGGLSGANFPMTAAIVSDYYGENDNAVIYGSVYAWKALGGSFAGGLAALIMTGTLYGTEQFHWFRGFAFGVILAILASLVVGNLCKTPTLEQMRAAVVKASGRNISPVQPEKSM
jgi:MFS transporter, OFA family, oxalate/formate antiporter